MLIAFTIWPYDKKWTNALPHSSIFEAFRVAYVLQRLEELGSTLKTAETNVAPRNPYADCVPCYDVNQRGDHNHEEDRRERAINQEKLHQACDKHQHRKAVIKQ